MWVLDSFFFLRSISPEAYKPLSATKPISQTKRFSVDAWAKFSMAVFKEKLGWCIVLIDGCMSQINYGGPEGKMWLIHCTYWSVQWLHVMTVCHTQTCCMWEHVSANFFFFVVLAVKADCPQPPKELMVFTKQMVFLFLFLIKKLWGVCTFTGTRK